MFNAVYSLVEHNLHILAPPTVQRSIKRWTPQARKVLAYNIAWMAAEFITDQQQNTRTILRRSSVRERHRRT